MSIINQVPDGKDPFSVCLISTDCTTTSGIAHRVLEDNGHSDILLQYMENALQRHHISPEALQRHMDLIASLKIENLPIPRSPYPQTSKTQKGNFAEVFLAEYLVSTTDMELPIYRLRYNMRLIPQKMLGRSAKTVILHEIILITGKWKESKVVCL